MTTRDDARQVLRANLSRHPGKGSLPWQEGRDYGVDADSFFVSWGAQGAIGPFTRTDLRYADLARVEVVKKTPLIGAAQFAVRVGSEQTAAAPLYLVCDDAEEAAVLSESLDLLRGKAPEVASPVLAPATPPTAGTPPSANAEPPKPAPEPPLTGPLTGKELEERVTTLKGLFDKGLITKDEYDAKRKDLLERFR